MKVIDLLNKIANGEDVPKKIKYNDRDMFWCEPCKIYEVAEVKQGELCGNDLYNILDNLNDEVEIIEEDKNIEKLPILQFSDLVDMDEEELLEVIKEHRFKIIEIIDYINKEE